MCDRLNQNDNNIISNVVFYRFKKKLEESNYKIKCRKCQQNFGSVLLQKKDVYCNECLINYCVKTFRSTLGKSRLMKNEDKILIGFSGGFASIALIDLIHKGLDVEKEYQRLRFIPSLLFIDESILSDNDDKTFFIKNLYEFILKMKIDCHLISIQSCIEDLSNSNNYLSITFNDDNVIRYEDVENFFIQNNHSEMGRNFRNNLNNLDQDIKYDFLKRLRQLILIKMAKHLKMQKVFVASTMNELSINLFDNITFGRGIIVSNEISFCDDRYDNLLLLRPLCELSNKELMFYLKFRQLDQIVYRPNTQTKSPIKSSLNRINEQFLNSLSEEFPSTLYTINRIGNKINTMKTTTIIKSHCLFCLGDIEQNEQNQTCDDKYCYSCNRLNNAFNNKSNNDELIFQKYCILSNLIEN